MQLFEVLVVFVFRKNGGIISVWRRDVPNGNETRQTKQETSCIIVGLLKNPVWALVSKAEVVLPASVFVMNFLHSNFESPNGFVFITSPSAAIFFCGVLGCICSQTNLFNLFIFWLQGEATLSDVYFFVNL